MEDGNEKRILVEGPTGSRRRSSLMATKNDFFWFTPEEAWFAAYPEAVLMDTMRECARTKAVLVLDDFDAVFSKKEFEGKTSLWRLAMTLIEGVNEYAEMRIVAVCTDEKDVCTVVRQAVFGGKDNVCRVEFRNALGVNEWTRFWSFYLKGHPNVVERFSGLSNGFTMNDAFCLLDILDETHGNDETALQLFEGFRNSVFMRVSKDTANVPYTMIPGTMIKPNADAFNRVGGQEEAKRALIEALIWPKTRAEDMKRLGIRPIRGVLLHGPPGTGKTLLAKCASEASGCTFLSVSVPDLIRADVGVSEKRVKQLFETAKSCSPCVVFFDEAQALFRDRSQASSSGGKLVSQFLIETDALTENDGVTLLAATNEIHAMDPAFTRPGRFDRVVYVGPCGPNSALERVAVLRGVTAEEDVERFSRVDFEKWAEYMPFMFTGAQARACAVRALLNANALRGRHEFVAQVDVEQAVREETVGGV